MNHGREVSLDEWATISAPDIYFSKGYHEVSAHLEVDFADLVLLEWQDTAGAVYIPLVLREIAGQGYFDATNAYAHAGPWAVGRPNMKKFGRFFQGWAHDHKVVATFLQFHPLYDYATRFGEIFPLERAGQAVMWNLARGDLVAHMSSNHRRNWRRAINAGLETRVTVRPANLSNFRKLYELSMERLGVRSFYFFPDAYWAGLQDKLGDQLVQADAVHEGRTVASVLCFAANNFLHFHLNGATDEGRELRGPFVAHVGAAEWGKTQGYTTGSLGVTCEGSLFDFKNRFDPATLHRDFYVTHLIHDGATFRRLSEGLPTTRYFPPWRNQKLQGYQ